MPEHWPKDRSYGQGQAPLLYTPQTKSHSPLLQMKRAWFPSFWRWHPLIQVDSKREDKHLWTGTTRFHACYSKILCKILWTQRSQAVSALLCEQITACNVTDGPEYGPEAALVNSSCPLFCTKQFQFAMVLKSLARIFQTCCVRLHEACDPIAIIVHSTSDCQGGFSTILELQ